MFFDLHADCLSAPKPLARPRLFAENESKILAVFCEDLPTEARFSACERQYEKLRTAFSEHTLSPYPQEGEKRALLGMEGASGLRCAKELYRWKKRGLATLSLCWKSNRLATGWESNTDDGVSAEGVAFLREMRNLNIVADVSHLSARTALQAVAITGKGIATHSPFFALFPHPRNLPEKVADALFEAGGIVGLTPYPPFLGGDMQAFLQHVRYGIQRYGVKFLAIGTDTDGTKGVFCKELKGSLPLLPQLFFALANAFGKAAAYRICYENAQEFFSDTF